MTHFVENIILKSYTEEEQDTFVEMFMNEELCQYMAGGAFDKENDAIKLFDFFLQISAQKHPNKEVFGVFLDEKHIGHFEIDKKDQEIEIVYLLEKEYWGKGIMFKIIKFFNQKYDELIFARVMPSNNNSIKLLEKIGVLNKKLSTFNEQKVIKYTLSKTNEIMNPKEAHWTNAYQKTATEKLGWYEKEFKPSLDLIAKTGLAKNARILNVGAGSTTLVDDLVSKGYTNIIANDISESALQSLAERLKENKEKVVFVQDDLTKPKKLLNIDKVDLWNDRAVLHFFLEDNDIKAYFDLLRSKVKIAGFVILAEFALNGAAKCSGLDVKRYDIEMLKKELGDDFELIENFDYEFINPNGDGRPYIYSLFKRVK